MKICPTAPHAANERIAGNMVGLRWMKERASENSKLEGEGLRGVGGRRGETRR